MLRLLQHGKRIIINQALGHGTSEQRESLATLIVSGLADTSDKSGPVACTMVRRCTARRC